MCELEAPDYRVPKRGPVEILDPNPRTRRARRSSSPSKLPHPSTIHQRKD